MSVILPHLALSCNFSSAENLASLSLQDGATNFYYCQNPNSTNSSIQQSLRLDYILTPGPGYAGVSLSLAKTELNASGLLRTDG